MASLSPLTGKLDKRLAKHLLRRTTFSYNQSKIDNFSNLTVSDAVDSLFNLTSDSLSQPKDPNDGYWIATSGIGGTTYGDQINKRVYVSAWWFYNALRDTSIRHKMMLFLHNMFTIGNSSLDSHFVYDYLRLLNLYALGNIKELSVKMTTDNGMLAYLDNRENIASVPNENYAREFLELFTIGKGPQIGPTDYTTYTEADIVEAAKVFSGFRQNTDRGPAN